MDKLNAGARSALLWVLWGHQGGHSEVGQAVRQILGKGQFEEMTREEVELAKGVSVARAPSGTVAVCACKVHETTGWTTWGGIPLCNVCGLVDVDVALEMGRAALADKGD